MNAYAKMTLLSFCLFTLLPLGCGQDSSSSSGEGGTGSYQADLVFPEDIPRVEEIGEIDCEAAGIATIEFNFISDRWQYGPYTSSCKEHNYLIPAVPVGKRIAVEVSADDDDGNILLEGSEVVEIIRNQLTVGGEILMQYVPVNPSTPAAESFTNDFGMEFVRIPSAGQTFSMGSPPTELGRWDNETEHPVTLTRDFYLQTTEVTQGQWRAVVQAAGSPTTIEPDPSVFSECGDDCPVEHVSWDDVQLFIAALNRLGRGTYALPTEAQWEYAARGGTTSALPDGELTTTDCSLDPGLDLIAWYCANSDVDYSGCNENSADGRCIGPHPVRGRKPNPYGLYDMLGNVWEWCQDRYDSYPTTAQTDPTGPTTGSHRVIRGGGWVSEAGDCRSASRSVDSPYYWYQKDTIGFRLVCLQY